MNAVMSPSVQCPSCEQKEILDGGLMKVFTLRPSCNQQQHRGGSQKRARSQSDQKEVPHMLIEVRPRLDWRLFGEWEKENEGRPSGHMQRVQRMSRAEARHSRHAPGEVNTCLPQREGCPPHSWIPVTAVAQRLHGREDDVHPGLKAGARLVSNHPPHSRRARSHSSQP